MGQFSTDAQTLNDLNIFGKHGSDSMFALFNRCATQGGAAVLETLIRHPLADREMINRRSGIIRYFADGRSAFPFPTDLFDAAETYLANTDERTRLTGRTRALGERVGSALAPDAAELQLERGALSLAALLRALKDFVSALDIKADHSYWQEVSAADQVLSLAAFEPVLSARDKPGREMLAELDALLRFRHRTAVRTVLDYAYRLDAYMAVAKVAMEKGFVTAEAQPRDGHLLVAAGLYHPLVTGAVANNIDLTPEKNFIFLTGANMAGKSTLMKSLGIAVYLAHVGFPVAAKRMTFPVLDGMYTTINLPDNLGMGASHFYAEVLRVKKVAQELNRGKSLFVLFDELFRGTNVKDAHDGTVAIARGFSRERSSLFVVSTHIVEAGDVLLQECPSIRFGYLPTRMDGNRPVYTYQWEEGITDDRHGMVIINNEGILEQLAAGLGTGSKNRKPAPAGFITDRQTLEDLNLLGKFREGSVFRLFNQVRTGGGERLLEQLFREPLTDAAAINSRSAIFRYFGERKMAFPFDAEEVAAVEQYLSFTSGSNMVSAVAGMYWLRIQRTLLRDERYVALMKGLGAMVSLLRSVKALAAAIDIPFAAPVNALLSDTRLAWISGMDDPGKLSTVQLARYDLLLRHTFRQEMESILGFVYELDVYTAVSTVARMRGYRYAEALPGAQNVFHASAIRHPGLDQGVANGLRLDEQTNMLFLTGANMAGKSTLMKSFGIAVYLAHMGFPVAAGEMTFSVMDGLYTSINVPDNISQGYSHFYAEVLRVKQVAAAVSNGQRMVVLFDELFKGTNVKDAFDATLLCTAAFSRYRNCFFIISTHIIEVGEALRSESDNIQFAYMPTVMNGPIPTYTYRMTEGITEDRQGMMIVENEGILAMLK